jgi:RND family efflux transporter MFP subunit
MSHARSPHWLPRLCLALGAASAAAGCSEAPAVVPTPPPVVMVSKPLTRVLSDYEDFTGKTAAVESVDVRAQVTGYLQSIKYKEGSEVGGCERSATFAASGVGALASPHGGGPFAALANIPLARGSHGDLLFVIDPRLYQAAVDQAKANLEVAKATVTERQAAYDIAQQAGIGTSRLELAQRLGQLQVAQAQVLAAQAALDKAVTDLSFCYIRAPISGRIDRYLVTEGNLVKPDQTVLTTIVTVEPMYVYFPMDELTLERLKRLIRDGKLKAASEEEFTVTMGVAADNENRPNKGTVNIRAVFPNPAKNGVRPLTPGMFARVRVPIGEPRDRLLVSERAVGTDQGRKFLYVLNDRDEVVYRPVTVGRKDGSLRVIEAGLSPNERVIVIGLQRVRPGVRVEPKLIDMPVSPEENPKAK